MLELELVIQTVWLKKYKTIICTTTSEFVINQRPYSLVFFDLETTGLGIDAYAFLNIQTRTSHILQVAAVCGDGTFSTYVMPKEQITPSASEVTGLKLNNGWSPLS